VRYDQKNTLVFMRSIRYSRQILIKLEFSQGFEKGSNIKFHENLPSGSRAIPCDWTKGQPDMMKLIFAKLTLRGSCIVMYSYNESQRDALFLIFIL